ncbi:hypothetical protein [Leptospira sp. GIMC2001]|uniref:hypothetical protein n=1 Tax=Leptospira sp. GIMC2001 TaxID=1513297 RepID=UPI00234AE8C0|nr:hypothetical protein [Leptospira sp. GIMC2001]WCL51005.1 hypothetical protein O4O04_09395 [Leptospira sp. GIMC2001]
MNIYIHHFLLFSDSPDDTFNLIQEEYNLRLGFPLSNFGFFKSGMLWMKNSYVEIVNYPKDIPAPNCNQSKCRFVE